MRGRRHTRIPRAHAAVATASLVLLTMSLMVSQAHAADTRIMLTEGCTRVTLEVMPFEAAYTNEFIRVDTANHAISLGITNFDVEKTIQLDLPVGELVLGIRVENTGHTFTTAPASDSPDGFAHARISGSSASGWTVAFEDFLTGGDEDHNDAVLSVTLSCGTSTPNTPSTPDTPSTTNTPSTPGETGSTGDPGGGDQETQSEEIEYTVTLGIDPANTGSGETRGEGQYAEGDEATLMALPDDDSTFSRWSGDCSEMEQSASLTVVIDRDLTCPAAFDARPPATPAEDPAASVTNTRTSPATATATVDESVTFRIAVTLTAVPETSALELRLGYDPGHLEYTGADWNGIALPPVRVGRDRGLLRLRTGGERRRHRHALHRARGHRGDPDGGDGHRPPRERIDRCQSRR